MKLVSGNLWRGRRPTDLAAMSTLGVTRIISLQSGVEDRWTDSGVEIQRDAPEKFGIDYIYVSCPNWFPPSQSHVDRVMVLLEDKGPKTYIHCHSGVDRTGFMCAAYRVKFNAWPADLAVTEWKSHGRHWWFVWWEPFLRRALARVAAKV